MRVRTAGGVRQHDARRNTGCQCLIELRRGCTTPTGCLPIIRYRTVRQSPTLADFNNDGWPEVLIANGQLLPNEDAPHMTVGQPRQLWLNAGNGKLNEYRPSALSPLLDRQSARSMAVADFNNDGRLALVGRPFDQ